MTRELRDRAVDAAQALGMRVVELLPTLKESEAAHALIKGIEAMGGSLPVDEEIQP